MNTTTAIETEPQARKTNIKTMRSGSQYLESLIDGRQIFIDGRVVKDVTQDPAFSGISRSIARLYDLLDEQQSIMTFPSPVTGNPVAIWHMVPRSPDDLKKRRIGLSRFADASYGCIGRGPDLMGSFFAGFASAPELFSRSNPQFGENVKRFQQKVQEENLYVTCALIPPQIDRSKPAHQQGDSHAVAGVYKEVDGGIIIRGAQMLATGATVSDYLHLSTVVPLQPGDEAHALSLVVPINAPGLRFYPRRAYAANQPSVFDYPLSTRFDETDSLVVFRDVFVPWEDVFVYRDIGLTHAQWHETPAHVLGNNQAQIRLASKVKFLAGLGRKITQVNGTDKIPSVQWQLGELASWASLVEGMVLASEASAIKTSNGAFIPNPRFLYGAMGLQAELYPKIIQLVRELAGGGVLQVPASVHELTNPDTASDMQRYIRSSHLEASDKVKFFKLVWDMIGSEFAGRHQHYEIFYAGAPFVAKSYAYRNYNFEESLNLVEHCLKGYDLEGTCAESPTASQPLSGQ